MKSLFSLLLLAIPFVYLSAQDYPQRTPEDIARKQTEMMARELSIQDSLVKDTIFHMFLKYARMREVPHTRAQAIEYMLQVNEELQGILTPEQYQCYMNQQVNHAPHRHHAPHHRISVQEEITLPPQTNDEDTNKHQAPPSFLPLSRL